MKWLIRVLFSGHEGVAIKCAFLPILKYVLQSCRSFPSPIVKMLYFGYLYVSILSLVLLILMYNKLTTFCVAIWNAVFPNSSEIWISVSFTLRVISDTGVECVQALPFQIVAPFAPTQLIPAFRHLVTIIWLRVTVPKKTQYRAALCCSFTKRTCRWRESGNDTCSGK